MQVRFSIVIPIYNVELYLPQCVDSILCQSYTNYEVILVDDGSPDKCPQICDEYAKKDIRVKVVHKPNGGLVSARKAGALVATGDYIMAVDGDDWLTGDCLGKVNQVIEDYNPDVVRFGFIIADEDGRTIARPITNFRTGYYNRPSIIKEIIPSLIYRDDGGRFPHSAWAAAYRSNLYKQEQDAVADKIKIGEDGALTRPIIYNSDTIYLMEDCLYCYRRNLSSMTKERKPFSMDNFMWLTNHYSERMDLTKYDLQQQVDRSIVHNVFIACVTQFWKNEPYAKVRSQIMTFISRNDVKKAISNVRFKFSIGRFVMCLTMRYRLVPIMWVYSKIKEF